MHVYGANVSSLEFIAIGFHSLSVARWRMSLKSTNFIAHFISNSMTTTLGCFECSRSRFLSGSVNWIESGTGEDTLSQRTAIGFMSGWAISTCSLAACFEWKELNWVTFVDNKTSQSVIHFELTIKHKNFSSVIVFIHGVSVRSALVERLSPRLNFINEISCVLSLYDYQLKVQFEQKLSSIYDVAGSTSWILFQAITKHRFGFVLCFGSNGAFLWLSRIFSLAPSVIIIVSQPGDRTKKQLSSPAEAFGLAMRFDHENWFIKPRVKLSFFNVL